MSDKTLLERKKHVPQAEKIIAQSLEEFNQWIETRKFTPALVAVKKLMENIQLQELEAHRKKNPSLDADSALAVSDRLIQKLTNRMATHLRTSENAGESVKALKTLFNVTADE